ncbi:MAG: hypothetical protein LC793_16255 [Thermomicrobia bacterium]|nr:hypothetical protein [Thermomicrobia bacterium]MCA1723031.1 hypothetical protein [Thermomicrobia bacterium]
MREQTVGELCEATLGIPLREISDIDVWEFIGGAAEQGAYCPLDRRDAPNVWDRFVVPVRRGSTWQSSSS